MSHPTIKYEQIRGIAEGGGSSITSEEEWHAYCAERKGRRRERIARAAADLGRQQGSTALGSRSNAPWKSARELALGAWKTRGGASSEYAATSSVEIVMVMKKHFSFIPRFGR